MSEKFKQRKTLKKEEIKDFFQGRYIIGFSGYTNPPENSSYMETASQCVERVIEDVQSLFSQGIGLIYGSSDGGIDRIVESLWREKFPSLPLVGITCKEFIDWVPDEVGRPPVVIEGSINDYARLFVEELDLLVITGGRKHTLEHDLLALSLGKHVYVEDCALEVTIPFEKGAVQNAALLLKTRLHFGSSDHTSEERRRILEGIRDL